MSKPKKDDESYDPAEGRRRFEAALRGARVAGHKAMTDIAKKRAVKKPKQSKEKKKTEK